MGRSLILYHFAKKIRSFGKVRNTIIRYVIVLPLLFMVRLAILIYWFYFMVYQELFHHIKIVYHLNTTNWWKYEDEPFYTNCSVSNALFCWLWWSLAWVVGVYICICLISISLTLAFLVVRGESK